MAGQLETMHKLKNSGWKSPLPTPSRSDMARLHSSGVRHAELAGQPIRMDFTSIPNLGEQQRIGMENTGRGNVLGGDGIATRSAVGGIAKF